jgi:hypothetical protein
VGGEAEGTAAMTGWNAYWRAQRDDIRHRLPQNYVTCENCDGDGGYAVATWPSYADEERWVECPQCGGLGYVRGEGKPITEHQAIIKHVVSVLKAQAETEPPSYIIQQTYLHAISVVENLT